MGMITLIIDQVITKIVTNLVTDSTVMSSSSVELQLNLKCG